MGGEDTECVYCGDRALGPFDRKVCGVCYAAGLRSELDGRTVLVDARQYARLLARCRPGSAGHAVSKRLGSARTMVVRPMTGAEFLEAAKASGLGDAIARNLDDILEALGEDGS